MSANPPKGDNQRGESPPDMEQPVLDREQFAKISEVEGIFLSDDMKKTIADFDRRRLSPEERRRAIIGRFKRAGK